MQQAICIWSQAPSQEIPKTELPPAVFQDREETGREVGGDIRRHCPHYRPLYLHRRIPGDCSGERETHERDESMQFFGKTREFDKFLLRTAVLLYLQQDLKLQKKRWGMLPLKGPLKSLVKSLVKNGLRSDNASGHNCQAESRVPQTCPFFLLGPGLNLWSSANLFRRERAGLEVSSRKLAQRIDAALPFGPIAYL